MIETTFPYPVIPKQAVQVLKDGWALLFGNCITGQIDIAGTSPGFVRRLSDQISSHVPIAEGCISIFELCLPECFHSFACYPRIFKAHGQPGQALPVASMSLR